MKRSKLLAALIILSVSLLPLVPPQSGAQGSYTERLNVYVAGSNAAWFVSVGGVNVTNSAIASAESVSGLSSYNLTAILSTSWSGDFQVFGQQGYKVLPVPFVPPEGAFLTVGSQTFSDASSAAAKFGSYLVTTFHSHSNGSGVFAFFAPISFSSVVPHTLFSLLPLSEGGFLTPITAAKFFTLPSPMVTLSGQRTGSGFSHQLTVGSITSSGVDSTGRPNVLNYFGQAVASLQASNKSSSSTVALHFLDGLVVSSDSATLTNDRTAFSSSYTLSLKPGAKVSRINATVVQQPPELLATRFVDVGVLRPGSNMSVTISLTNLSNATALSKIGVNDSWWKTNGHFKLVSGSSDISVANLGVGQSSTPTYVLQYLGNATQQLALPPTPVSYSYAVGTTTEAGHASLNPMTISLGIDEPVVFAYLAPWGTLGVPVGSNQSLKVVLKNVGTRSASSVSVGGHQVGGLPSDGGSATVSLSTAAPSLAKANVTKSYTVTYTTPGGQAASLTTNSLQVVFSHTGMKIGLAVLALNASISQMPGGSGYSLQLTVDLANKGAGNLTSFAARATLPANLPCGKPSSNLTCSGSSFSVSYPLVKPSGKQHESLSFNVTQPSSLIFWPATFSFQSGGYALTGYSNAQPAPTGLVLTKQFSPTHLFPTMTSQVTALARNSGPYTIYNATLATTSDVFDSTAGNQSTSKGAQTLAPASNITLSFGVTVGSFSGSPSASPAVARFFMGGTAFTLSTSFTSVQLEQPPRATVVTSPGNPVEGSQFTVTVTITNPASVGVANVKFLLPIPSGVKVSIPSNACVSCTPSIQKDGLGITVDSLGPGSSISAQATVSANSGQTIPFNAAKLTFGFANQTLSGRLPSGGIAVAENVSTRYVVPIGVAILAMLAVAYEVRRMAGATVPASQK